ncbi:pyruvate kinase [Pontimicrobium sp. IMCC45349]|uniref:pyruvate kinase n=1 Tax=Pontimicrobium sp. IMCC45349 TaxID=3391574 RepID=UPI00399F3CF6
MVFNTEQLQEINTQIDLILDKISEYETRYQEQINNVHPKYIRSAKNLIHYLALRSFDNVLIEEKISNLELPSTSNNEGSILNGLISYKTILNTLLKKEEKLQEPFINNKEAKDLLKKNTKALFGKSHKKRRTRIMVTQPTLAAEEKDFAKSLIKKGMNAARINCAHDDENVWKTIIEHIKSSDLDCKIMMDLGGPKLRTGKMKPGPKVVHIKPHRNNLGQVVNPALVWLAPFGILPPNHKTADFIIPVNKKWLKKTKKGSYIIFKDARDKKCKLVIEETDGFGRWALCSDSAFVTSDTLLNVFLEKKSKSEIQSVQEILPLEEVIYLFEGDLLRLDKAPILGEPAKLDENGKVIEIAHISCSLPEVFSSINIKEKVFFDDGKIEGIIKEKHSDYLLIEITSTKKNGGKLKAEKGINFPNSILNVSGLTEKDKQDLKFVTKHADAVNFSFVNNKQDVEDLLTEMKQLEATLGIILKIETQEAYKNLPSIILKAMENYPIGVMIARGDLAIETGWDNFAIIQEEILRLCEAAHIPDIWATQVLETLAKKGIPTRSEITDAAMAQRAECVMLNKGYYIEKAVKMLHNILCEMQRIQKKKKNIFPELRFNPIA